MRLRLVFVVLRNAIVAAVIREIEIVIDVPDAAQEIDWRELVWRCIFKCLRIEWAVAKVWRERQQIVRRTRLHLR